MVQPSGPIKVEAFVLERAPAGEMLSWCNFSTLCGSHHVTCEPHYFKIRAIVLWSYRLELPLSKITFL